MDIVTVECLRKTYGDFAAVDGISFGIAAGEIFGFLGPNGAGKTSTINMLIGLSRPSSGKIEIDGIDGVREVKKAQSILGIVPDESNLYDEMNGFDNLCFCASLFGIPRRERERRARALLEQFHLDGTGNRPFKAYSKGMRRKLTIAAGIIHHPKILFLDEPTTGIDVESARQIRGLILDLKRRGTTVFLTTHYIEDAQRVCDRIGFIVSGKLVRTGTIHELMESANREYRVRLSLSHRPAGLTADLARTFPSLRVEADDERACLLYSPERIALLPILERLACLDVSVFEARELLPTLEDVFVEITGIEAGKLQKEKEGAKK